jgi:hypothetical protein
MRDEFKILEPQPWANESPMAINLGWGRGIGMGIEKFVGY